VNEDNIPEGGRKKLYWRIASGAADSNIRLWVDITEEEEAAERARRAMAIEQEQELANALRAKAYNKAIGIGFQLDQPRMLLKVFTECIEGDGMVGAEGEFPLDRELRENSVQNTLVAIVQNFSDDQLGKCLRYVRDWNTNSRHVAVAQRVLRAVFRARGLKRIKNLPGIGEVFEGILAYSERHMLRADKIVQQTYILDYALTRMKVILPADASETSLIANSGIAGSLLQKPNEEDTPATARFENEKLDAGRGVAETLPPLPQLNSENRAFRGKKKTKRAERSVN